MKTFVLGLDGATFDLVLPMVEDGVVPNLARLMEEGARAPLRSTFPPVTAPAWLALATGQNPGRTGVFDYINRIDGRFAAFRPVSSEYYYGRSIWDHLNRQGYSTGIFNFPTLFPPPAVQGYAVSGMGAGDGEICHPSSLKKELERVTGGLKVSINLMDHKYRRNPGRFLHDIEDIVTRQERALRYLLREHPCDFHFAVFSWTDWMQHVLWKYLDERHPLFNRAEAQPVLRGFRKVWAVADRIVGDLQGSLPPGTNLVIVSDHGAGPLDSMFFANSWLKSEGMLAKKRLGWRGTAAKRFRVHRLNPPTTVLKRAASFLRHKILRVPSMVDLIDLDRSLAYCPEHNTMFGCINLTERGRAQAGTRDRIAASLRLLPGSSPGLESVEVFYPEDLYEGPFVSQAPDILFVINDYRCTVELDLAARHFKIRNTHHHRSGGHKPLGVFVGHGPAFRAAQLAEASVMDLAPTVLALYGVGIPQSVDGRVLVESLRPEIARSLDVRIVTDGERGREGPSAGGEEDLEKMKNLLKSLGYM